MNTNTDLGDRTNAYLLDQLRGIHVQADRLFALLMGLQFVGCVIVASIVSPRTWIGSASSTHIHVYASMGLGLVIAVLPIVLALTRPGDKLTRHVIAAAQMMMSALLIHVSGGRIETHFHVFGSLAFLAFYRDWRVLLTATAVTSLDHFFRGVFWPESVFGVLTASQWRWLEHVGWVLFADLFLIRMCVLNIRQMRGLAEHQAELELTKQTIEHQVVERTRQFHESEARYKSFVSNVPGIVYRAELGEDGRILIVGGASEPLCGYPITHFIENGVQAFVDVLHEDDRARVIETIERSSRTDQPFATEYRVRHRDGSIRWVSDSMRPNFDEDGAFLYHDGILLDITEQHHVQERLDLALRAANEGLWDWDLRADEVYFNDTVFTMLGYGADELPKTLETWKRLLHPDDLQQALAETERHLTGELPIYRCEVRARAKDGGWRWLIDVGEVTERDENGKPTRMLGVHIDITEQREAREQAESADRAKSEFLSNMSHELRTPLNGVLGYAQILLRDPALTTEQRESMGAIRNCGQHLLTLINDVLDLSKIESGRLEIERQDVDLQRLLVSVRDVLAQRATEKGVALVLDVAPEIPRGVHTDPTKLRQVLVNLAGNAVKFTEAGAVTIRVTEPKIGRFRFEVEDTGIGMSEQELADVFDAFRQAAAGKAAGGTGLGLAITKRVVEALGGEVEVVSTPGVGTTFAFEVPLEEVDELKLQPQDTDDLDDSTTLRLPEGRTVTVLVADDRRDNRDILDRFLSPIGCEVLHAENGREAIDKLEHAQVDIVLMDVRMPVMNGLEATRRIRQNPSLSGLLVIAVSASVFENQRERIKEAGCDDFIGKPLRAAELYRKLAEYLDLPLQHGDDHRPSAEPGADALEPDRAAAIADAIVESTAIGDVGSLDNLAKELLSGTAVEQALGRRIEPLVRGFDLEGLKAIAEQVREENQP